MLSAVLCTGIFACLEEDLFTLGKLIISSKRVNQRVALSAGQHPGELFWSTK